jgi:hypothetical protein
MKRAGWGDVKVKKNSGQTKTSKKKKPKETLTEQKTKAEVRKLKIGNEKEINTLVLRTLTRAILEEIGHSIQTNFINLPRRESATIAAMVGVPEKERIIEKYLSEKIQDAVISLQSQIAEKVADGTFE